MVASSIAGRMHTRTEWAQPLADTHDSNPLSPIFFTSGPHSALLFSAWCNYTTGVNHDWIFSGTNSHSIQAPCSHQRIYLPYSTLSWEATGSHPWRKHGTWSLRDLPTAAQRGTWSKPSAAEPGRFLQTAFLKINTYIWLKNYYLDDDITRSMCSWALSTSEKRWVLKAFYGSWCNG